MTETLKAGDQNPIVLSPADIDYIISLAGNTLAETPELDNWV